MSQQTKMVGRKVVDHHKNTARSKHVNDRLRRRVKRIERSKIEWASSITTVFGR